MRMATAQSFALITVILAAPLAFGQDSAAPPAAAPAADGPADAVPTKSLQAVIMDVQGKARWRPGPDAEWHDAKVNDLIDPGTEVRTGLRSRVTMRVGRNATVLVDSGTSFELPEVVMEGQTLRTTATVKTGRVDFKVDKVGFANDFKVVTPQTTLAVRGTGFSLATGPLNGFEVTGARTNAMNAIELRYVQQNVNYFLSGNAQSSTDRPDPVHNAWMSTIGPPPVVGTIATAQQLVQQASQGTAGNAPTNPQQYQQQNAAESNGTGGNALIQAANTDGASDDLKDFARDATGNQGAVPPSGDALLAQLQDPFLRDELKFVRREAPPFMADMDRLSRRSSELSDAADQLDAVYGETGSAWNDIPSVTTDGGAMAHLDRVINQGIEEMPRMFATEIAATETALGASLFTAPARGGNTGGDGGFGGGTTALTTASSFGILNALHNARTWAVQDDVLMFFSSTTLEGFLADADSSPGMAAGMLREMSALDHRWRPDSYVLDANQQGTGAQTPVILALRMNEAIQSAWDSAVSAMLGAGPGSAGAAQRDVARGMDRIITALRSDNLGDTQLVLPDYLAEYAKVASIENTEASAQAGTEFAQIVSDAKAAVDSALSAAVDAANRAGNARTQGQRVFLQAVENAYISQAADIAMSCQEDTLEILNRSVSITERYRTAKERVRSAGQLPPDLDRGRNVHD